MKILVAIEESPCSDAAVASLMARVWKPDTEVLVLTVIPTVASEFAFAAAYAVVPLLEADPQESTFKKKLVADKVLELQSHFAKDLVSGRVAQGDAAEIIIDTADAWDADLIVVGSHGREGFEKFFLGSVAETVAKKSRCSVEIVRQKQLHGVTGAEIHKNPATADSEWQNEVVC